MPDRYRKARLCYGIFLYGPFSSLLSTAGGSSVHGAVIGIDAADRRGIVQSEDRLFRGQVTGDERHRDPGRTFCNRFWLDVLHTAQPDIVARRNGDCASGSNKKVRGLSQVAKDVALSGLRFRSEHYLTLPEMSVRTRGPIPSLLSDGRKPEPPNCLPDNNQRRNGPAAAYRGKWWEGSLPAKLQR